MTSGQTPSAPQCSQPTVPQTVRFASVNQEIEPAQDLHTNTEASDTPISRGEIGPDAEDELRNLALGLHNSHLHQRRTSNFAFEPVSLPVSRAPSNESSPYHTSREATRSGAPSPKMSPHSTMTTPPLTPAGVEHLDGPRPIPDGSGAKLAKVPQDPVHMAPQTSGKGPSPSSAATSRPSTPSEPASTRPTSSSQGSYAADRPKRASGFVVGPSDGSATPAQTDSSTSRPSESSVPPSREISPTQLPEAGSGTVTPPSGYQRPFTPVGDRDDPYARSRRPPQTRNLDTIDKRFVFGDVRRRSGVNLAAGSSGALPRSNSGNDLKAEHRKSTFSVHGLGSQKDHVAHTDDKPHGSMSELKRFFGIGGHHKKRAQSPAKSAKASLGNNSGVRTPPHQQATTNVPFADDHGLQTKWGKFGKVLGSGAGGSVKLMKRSSDGLTFAVKQFRDRHSYETEREYNKKVTAEFCIGSTLHHGNIIETLDIVHEKGHWYEGMEYAPFDLFAIVMTGKMSREEVACSFLQIVSGVTFLHSMGLAHRDLKLDNVVVNEHGIMKLIDFGSASVFKYPFENDIILASGKLSTRPKKQIKLTGIRSCGFRSILGARSLRSSQIRSSTHGHMVSWHHICLHVSATLPVEDAPRNRQFFQALHLSAFRGSSIHRDRGSKSATDVTPGNADERRSLAPAHHHHHHHDQPRESPEVRSNAHESTNPGPRVDAPKDNVIKGPWRLLRLLPRESRTIMGKMLQVNPKDRATLEDMLSDPWISTTPVCAQVEGGKVIKAPGHEHTLEPGTPAPAQSQK